jgi:uncharacterized protein YukE
MDGFRLDPEQLRGRATALTDAGRSFGDQLNSFQSQISGLEGAWGDDLIGGLIGTAYTVVVQWATECWQDVVSEVTSAADDLGRMAQEFEEAEEAARETFDRLTQAFG